MPDPVVNRKLGEGDGSVIEFTWTMTTADPIGTPAEVPEWADRTVQISSGAVGSATLQIQGAGTNTGSEFAVLFGAHDGLLLQFTTVPHVNAIVEGPHFMRPELTVVGTAAVWKVILTCRRATPMRT